MRPATRLALAKRHAAISAALIALVLLAGLYEAVSPLLLAAIVATLLLHRVLVIQPALRRVEQAERALRATERRYQGIFDNAVDGIFQTTPDGRYLIANQALARIYGYASPAELIDAVTDVRSQLYVEPNRRQEFEASLRDRDRVVEFESRTFRRDGSMIWISENARAVRDEEGRLLYYEGSVTDVTTRKRAEEDLRQRESELRRHRDHLEDMVQERTNSLTRLNERLAREMAERQRTEAELRLRDRAIASISEGIAITDPRRPGNPLIYVNPGFERLTGYAREDILGRNCRFLQGPDTDRAAVERVRDAVREERECVVELLNYRKDGSPFWNLLSTTPVRDPEGVLVGFIGVQFDITERKRVESLKDDLVTTVSHELRTPLASLRGFAELMLERDFPRDKQREFLTVIHTEALRLTRLVNDFLDLQRIESGQLGYRFATLDLAATLREAVSLFAMQSPSHELQLDLRGELPAVHADADQVRRVVANLLSNAVKFSPDGGRVTVAARAEGGLVRVSVADQGIGIDPAFVGELFRKFHRLENGRARQIRGTGLGLALVREMVEAHGGTVGVESRPGAGSTFTFTLRTVAAAVQPRSEVDQPPRVKRRA